MYSCNEKYAISHKTCDSYDPHIYPHSATMNFHQLRWCLPATCPWVDFSGSLRKIEPSLRQWRLGELDSWTWPHLHFCGSKKLWSMEMSKVRTCDSDQNTIFDSLPADFFCFQSLCNEPIRVSVVRLWQVLEGQPNSSREKRCELQTLLQLWVKHGEKLMHLVHNPVSSASFTLLCKEMSWVGHFYSWWIALRSTFFLPLEIQVEMPTCAGAQDLWRSTARGMGETGHGHFPWHGHRNGGIGPLLRDGGHRKASSTQSPWVSASRGWECAGGHNARRMWIMWGRLRSALLGCRCVATLPEMWPQQATGNVSPWWRSRNQAGGPNINGENPISPDATDVTGTGRPVKATLWCGDRGRKPLLQGSARRRKCNSCSSRNSSNGHSSRHSRNSSNGHSSRNSCNSRNSSNGHSSCNSCNSRNSSNICRAHDTKSWTWAACSCICTGTAGNGVGVCFVGWCLPPSVIPCLGGGTSINISYFGANRRVRGWTDPQPHCPSKAVCVFKQRLQSCFGSLHKCISMQDLGYLWTLYLSLPIVQNLSVFVAHALEAALLRRRRHSKDTCCWADASTVMRSLPQKHNFDVIQMCRSWGSDLLWTGATESSCLTLRGLMTEDYWVHEDSEEAAGSSKCTCFHGWSNRRPKFCWPDTDRIVPCQRHGNILHVGIWGIHWCRIWNFPWAWICSWPPVALVSD